MLLASPCSKQGLVMLVRVSFLPTQLAQSVTVYSFTLHSPCSLSKYDASSAAIDFISRLLVINPSTRWTASQALDHDFFWTQPPPSTLPESVTPCSSSSYCQLRLASVLPEKASHTLSVQAAIKAAKAKSNASADQRPSSTSATAPKTTTVPPQQPHSEAGHLPSPADRTQADHSPADRAPTSKIICCLGNQDDHSPADRAPTSKAGQLPRQAAKVAISVAHTTHRHGLSCEAGTQHSASQACLHTRASLLS